MTYFYFFALAALLAAALTPLVRNLARRLKVVDIPDQNRKFHASPTPLLGGLAIYVAFLAGLAVYLKFGHPDFTIVPMKFFWGIILGGLVLVVGGALDDKFNLPPKLLWLFPAIASAVIIWSGIGVGITHLTNPFGPPININYTLKLSAVSCQLSAEG